MVAVIFSFCWVTEHPLQESSPVANTPFSIGVSPPVFPVAVSTLYFIFLGTGFSPIYLIVTFDDSLFSSNTVTEYLTCQFSLLPTKFINLDSEQAVNNTTETRKNIKVLFIITTTPP